MDSSLQREPADAGLRLGVDGCQKIRTLLLSMGVVRRAARWHGRLPIQGLRPGLAVREIRQRPLCGPALRTHHNSGRCHLPETSFTSTVARATAGKRRSSISNVRTTGGRLSSAAILPLAISSSSSHEILQSHSLGGRPMSTVFILGAGRQRSIVSQRAVN